MRDGQVPNLRHPCSKCRKKTRERKKCQSTHPPSPLYFRPWPSRSYFLYLSPFFFFIPSTHTLSLFSLLYSHSHQPILITPTADELRTEYLLWHSRVPESCPQKLKIQRDRMHHPRGGKSLSSFSLSSTHRVPWVLPSRPKRRLLRPLERTLNASSHAVVLVTYSSSATYVIHPWAPEMLCSMATPKANRGSLCSFLNLIV